MEKLTNIFAEIALCGMTFICAVVSIATSIAVARIALGL